MADIMDKIVDGMNKGIAAVSSGSKFIIEQANIKTRIKALENEKKNCCSYWAIRFLKCICQIRLISKTLVLRTFLVK